MKHRTLLCLNGEPPNPRLVQSLVCHCDQVIAADGAADWLAQQGIEPELIIGDLDSLTQKGLTPLLQITSQDNTDAEKALDWLDAQGVQEVWVLGALGGRADFSLYNLTLPLKYPRLSLVFYHQKERIFLAPFSVTWQEVSGSVVSLLPVGGPVIGVTTQGLQWNLNHADLAAEGLQSQSNKAVSQTIKLTYTKGHLLVFCPHHY